MHFSIQILLTNWCPHFISNTCWSTFPVPTGDFISQSYPLSSHHLHLLIMSKVPIWYVDNVYSSITPPSSHSPKYQRCTEIRQYVLRFPCCDWLYYKWSVRLQKNSSEERGLGEEGLYYWRTSKNYAHSYEPSF